MKQTSFNISSRERRLGASYLWLLLGVLSLGWSGYLQAQGASVALHVRSFAAPFSPAAETIKGETPATLQERLATLERPSDLAHGATSDTREDTGAAMTQQASPATPAVNATEHSNPAPLAAEPAVSRETDELLLEQIASVQRMVKLLEKKEELMKARSHLARNLGEMQSQVSSR